MGHGKKSNPLGIFQLMGVDIESIFAAVQLQVEWAEDEIRRAQQRHGQSGDTGSLWDSFGYMRRSKVEMNEEIIFRTHVRELLERVIAGKALEPGTDAEMLMVIREMSAKVPLTPSVACLFFRLAARTARPLFDVAMTEIDLAAYESVHGTAADDWESKFREKLTTDRDPSGL